MSVLEKYVLAMRMEGISAGYERDINYTINALTKFVKKDFREMTSEDLLSFLSQYRKPDPADPLHKWVGTYNIHLARLIKFFKWIYYPDIPSSDSLTLKIGTTLKLTVLRFSKESSWTKLPA